MAVETPHPCSVIESDLGKGYVDCRNRDTGQAQLPIEASGPAMCLSVDRQVG